MPLPVLEAARMSLPTKACGITHLWISVILKNLFLLSPLRVSRDKGRSPNMILSFFFNCFSGRCSNCFLSPGIR